MISSKKRLALGLLALMGTSALLVALLVARIVHTHNYAYMCLFKNLALAWIPLLFALGVHLSIQRFESGTREAAALVFGTGWLAFFPNAPYLVTDLMHLRVHGNPLLWFDLLVLPGFAWTGLCLGLASLYLIHRSLARTIRGAGAWCAAVAFTVLAAFGVHLGRYGRWNSWDLLTKPYALVADILETFLRPLAHVQTFAFCAVWSAFLLFAYMAFYALAHASENR